MDRVRLFIVLVLMTPPLSTLCGRNIVPHYRTKILLPRHCESFVSIGRHKLLAASCSILYSITQRDGKTSQRALGAIADGRGHIIKQIVPLGKRRILLAACDGRTGQLYLSCDDGRTFTKVCDSTGEGQILAYDRPDRTLYAAGILSNVMFISQDLGNSWREIAAEPKRSSSYTCSMFMRRFRGRVELIRSCSRPGSILKTSDTGKSWRIMLSRKGFTGRELPQVTGVGSVIAVCGMDEYDSSGYDCYVNNHGHWHFWRNGFSAWSVAVDSDNPSRLVLGHFAPHLADRLESCVFESVNGGKTWRGLDSSGASYVWMVKYLSDGRILAATEKGLLQLSPISEH